MAAPGVRRRRLAALGRPGYEPLPDLPSYGGGRLVGALVFLVVGAPIGLGLEAIGLGDEEEVWDVPGPLFLATLASLPVVFDVEARIALRRR